MREGSDRHRHARTPSSGGGSSESSSGSALLSNDEAASGPASTTSPAASLSPACPLPLIIAHCEVSGDDAGVGATSIKPAPAQLPAVPAPLSAAAAPSRSSSAAAGIGGQLDAGAHREQQQAAVVVQ